MVMELLQGGNLRKHLMSIRGRYVCANLHTALPIAQLMLGTSLSFLSIIYSCSEIQSNSAELPITLLKFCRQVAEGLSYLAGKSFVHRDIAARNILLDKELNCKVRGGEGRESGRSA